MSNTLAMSPCFMPAFPMAIVHTLSSYLFADLSNIRVLRLLHDSMAKGIHLAYQLLDSTVSLAFRSWTEVNETYPKLVAKIQVYMSNKTHNLNYFSLLQKSGSYKICLTLWQ